VRDLYTKLYAKIKTWTTKRFACSSEDVVHIKTCYVWVHFTKFQLGVVWPPSLQSSSRSKRLPSIYLPEELIWSQHFNTNGELVSKHVWTNRWQTFLTQAYKTCSSIQQVVTTLRSILNMHAFSVCNIFFVVACFANSSLEVTFQIALILSKEYKFWSSLLCSFLQRPISPNWDNNIMLMKQNNQRELQYTSDTKTKGLQPV
jgi:hypothetical protein